MQCNAHIYGIPSNVFILSLRIMHNALTLCIQLWYKYLQLGIHISQFSLQFEIFCIFRYTLLIQPSHEFL